MAAMTARFKYFTGVDVGKHTLVIFESRTQKLLEIPNHKTAIKRYLQMQVPYQADTFLVCETTGGYEALLLQTCAESGQTVHRANTFQVKAFIRSLGLHGKTDAIDARALAQYALERCHRLTQWHQPNENIKLLKQLMLRRQDLKQMATQEKNRLQAPDSNPFIQKTIRAILRSINTQIQAIDTKMALIVKQNDDLRKKEQIMTEITGVGSQTAYTLLATMPELGTMTRRQTASLAGLAPHPRDSGTATGRRVIKGGRRDVRAILFMAAMSARQHHPELKHFYLRLIQNGKKPIVAITAIMRKLITIINAKIRDFMIQNQLSLEQS